jgi:anti-sigma factor RsiW
MLAALPPEFREVLILREMEDMSYRDNAAVTDVPIGTVMSRLARAHNDPGKMGIGKRMSCPERPRTQCLPDGELDETNARGAELHIESCDACRLSRMETEALGHYIRHGAARYSAPGERRRSFWFGAAGGATFTALAAGLALFVMLPPSPASLTGAVTDAHVRALMSGHTIEVLSSNHHTVKPWFAGRVPISPPVADFAREGFALAGGRTDVVAGSQALAPLYPQPPKIHVRSP